MKPFVVRAMLPSKLEDVVEMFAHQPDAWMEPFLRIAAHLADVEGLARARAIGRDPVVSLEARRVHIAVRPPRHHVSSFTPRAVLAFRWHTHGYATIFELLEGRFVLDRAGSQTWFEVEARASPPEWLDDAAGHVVVRRTSTATVSRFLETLRTAMAEMARTAQPM